MLGRLLAKYPILSNSVIYGSLYVGAELGQQLVNSTVLLPEGKTAEPIDTGSLARYGVMGTFVFPQTLYHGYRLLERALPGNSPAMALRKLAVDALVMTPCNITLFYVGMSAMEGQQDVLREWKQKFLTTFVTASAFWVPANFINFRLLPPHMRVVFVGGCQIVWVSTLCYLKKTDL